MKTYITIEQAISVLPTETLYTLFIIPDLVLLEPIGAETIYWISFADATL